MHLIPMDCAPRDGSRIILYYAVRTHGGKIDGYKWEECRWIDEKARYGVDPYWEPWCGREQIRTTLSIDPSNAIAWIPLPNS